MTIAVEIVRHGTDWAIVAAMVQAVGSVLAIVAAVVIARNESLSRQSERRAVRKEFRASVAALARRMADLIGKEAEDIAENPSSYRIEDFDGAPYEILDAVLARFDPSLMDSVQGALAIEEIRRAGRAAPGWIAALAQESNNERPGDSEPVSRGAHRWAMEANEAANTLELLARTEAHAPARSLPVGQ